MALTRHVDPTLARHPPGGKIHYLDDKEAEKLPTERGIRAPAKRRSRSTKQSAKKRSVSA